MTSKPNTDPETNLAYGVVGSHVLDADIVDNLLYGGHITNHTYDAAKAEMLRVARASGEDIDEDELIERFADGYEAYEDHITGTYEGVTYASSWIGGALHFFITKSPYTKAAAPCSPCAPGAGDLHNEGSLLTYDVPPEWRA